MSTVKSFSVGNGDTFYIKHNSGNFKIIDCFLSEENKENIVKEIKREIRNAHDGEGVTRFISTHPDEDHIKGLKYLDENIGILNLYCTKNEVTKEDPSDDFKHYCSLRDSEKVFHVEKGSRRKWMNEGDDSRGHSGLHVLWPDTSNDHYKDALTVAQMGGSPNNISIALKYGVENGAAILWPGDLETDFMEKIADSVAWPKVDVVFAAHHGRDSGRIPHRILDLLKPKIIVIGEAPSRHLHYYGGYNTLTQISAGDITFKCIDQKVHIYASEIDYDVDFLDYEHCDFVIDGSSYYIGTLNL